VLAHQQAFTNSTTAAILQTVYRNTGRGFKAGGLQIPADVAISRNLQWWPQYPGAPGQQTSSPGAEWPRVGAPDRARFVDLDNDGLVDIVVAGDCNRQTATGPLNCVPARWYRNTGDIPDRLTKVSSTTGAWTEVTYDSPKSNIMQLPADGLRPAASARIVKTIRSAAGPVPTPAGYDPFPVEEIRLSYENYVKDLVESEAVGFEKVKADFINEFNGTARETVRVTQTFDVRPQISGITLRHPLRGALVSTVTESGGWTATDLEEHYVEILGDGVRIRPLREIHLDRSASGTFGWSARETTQFAPHGFPATSVTGPWNGGSIFGRSRTTVLTYEHRTAPWQLGLATRETLVGYSEDIQGTPNASATLSDIQTSYDALGRVQSSTRLNIRGGTCAGPNDDSTTFEYFSNGLIQAVHELAVHDPDTGATHTRDVTTTYQALNLYPASVTVRAGKLVGGAFTPAQTTLTTTFVTDHRTGQHTKIQPPSGASTNATYDTRGRETGRFFNSGGTVYQLVSSAYVDQFPLRRTDTLTTDAGKAYTQEAVSDADGNVLSVVRGVSGCTQCSRTVKARYDAFGRAVETYHPKFVGSINAGPAPDPSGVKDVATFDGFDRVTQKTDAAGSTYYFVYDALESFEINPRGFLTKRTFDEFGDIVKLTRNEVGAASERSVHTFVRDGRGETLKVIDDDGSVRRFERDGGGRLLKLTLPTAAGATPSVFSMCHDVDDKLVQLRSPEGREIEVVHDELGRTLATRGSDANGLFVETTHTYDDPNVANGLGRLRSRTDESGQYFYQWDTFGFPSFQSYAPSTRAKAGATNVAASYGATYGYTRTGSLKSVTFSGLPQAAALAYTLDAFARPTTVTSRIGTYAPALVAADLVYDAAGRVTNARYGNNHTASWTFDPESERLERIAYRSGSNTLYTAVNYYYDDNSNIIGEERERSGVAGVWRRKNHSFDALDRLSFSSWETATGRTIEGYTYNSSGNLTQAGFQAYTYGSPASSQAASRVEDSSTGSTRTLAYDDDGYLTSDSTTNANGSRSDRSFAFDPMGCMRSIARVDRASTGEVTSTASSDYTCGLGGRVIARATTLPTGAKSRRIDFAGIAEIRPDENIFMMRIPVGGTVAFEDGRSLSTGFGDVSSTYLVSDVRGSIIAASSWDSAAGAPSREAEFDAWAEGSPGLFIAQYT
jgi:YD repeat-containing protein